MPNENLTEIVCIIDRSGSMGVIRDDAQEGFNSFIDDQKKVPGEATVTLVQFNTEYETLWENKPLQEVPKYKLHPRGATALLDAVGTTINSVGKRLENAPEEKRPGKVVFVIVTDGQENSSREFKRTQIMEILKHQRETYSWEFIFLAANQDAIEEAGSIGIGANFSTNFAATGQGTRSAYAMASKGIGQYRTSGDAQALHMPDYADDEDSQKVKKGSRKSKR